MVRARWGPQGMEEENAKGPAGIGQYVDVVLSSAGSGDGGRSGEQRYELLIHAFRVSTEVVVKRVARKNK